MDSNCSSSKHAGLAGTSIEVPKAYSILQVYVLLKGYLLGLRYLTRGDLRLCLFGNTGTNIRHLLQSDDQKEELVDLVISQLRLKKASHHLELGDTGITPNLSSTGG